MTIFSVPFIGPSFEIMSSREMEVYVGIVEEKTTFGCITKVINTRVKNIGPWILWKLYARDAMREDTYRNGRQRRKKNYMQFLFG